MVSLRVGLGAPVPFGDEGLSGDEVEGRETTDEGEKEPCWK